MNRARRIALLVLIVLGLVAGLTLGLFNAEPVTFHYLAGEVEVPLIGLLIAAAFLALALAAVVSAFPLLRQKRKIARLQRELDALRARAKVERQLPPAA